MMSTKKLKWDTSRELAQINEENSLVDNIDDQFDSNGLNENRELAVTENFFDILSLADATEIVGDHETQVSEGGEADLHKYLTGCTKNPGHAAFIPFDTFDINHLPEGYSDKDLYEHIKVTADLTVRVDVKMTSPDRPEFWPNTKTAYPFHNMSGKKILRYGTGTVSGMNRYKDGIDDEVGIEHYYNNTKCWCKKCQQSDTAASNVWWEFSVVTATHVVFDDLEVSHTSLRLFYDREESSPVVIIDQVIIIDVNIERDVCELKCVTCDKNLADRMDVLWEHFVDVWGKVKEKYKETRDVDKLAFIVSHPHGCAKHISVGHWVDKYRVGEDDDYKFTYTTCTCPGSSGARVQCVGYEGDGWLCDHLVHSGTLNSKLNCSGVNYVC